MAIQGDTIASIGPGLLVFLGIKKGDTDDHVQYLAKKVLQCRLFVSDNQKMGQDIRQVGGEILVVSQFTLYGNCRKGNRPSFDDAAPPQQAEDLYRHFLSQLKGAYDRVQAGKFAANMQVSLTNDGPVTLLLEHP